MDIDDVVYEDTGCKFFSRCLECPFERCQEEVSEQTRKASKRYEGIRKKFELGISREELVEEFGVSKRTIRRALNGK